MFKDLWESFKVAFAPVEDREDLDTYLKGRSDSIHSIADLEYHIAQFDKNRNVGSQSYTWHQLSGC